MVITFALCTATIRGQETEQQKQLMQNINTSLSQGDCDRAQRNYNAWKEFTKSVDSSIEHRIAACKGEKIDTVIIQSTELKLLQADTIDVKPITDLPAAHLQELETQLEISTSNLSFNSKGNDEKIVSITSNAPWMLSYKPDWIKTTENIGSNLVIITCKPNINRIFRKDSIIVKSGNMRKAIYIEQSPVTESLLTKYPKGQQTNKGKVRFGFLAGLNISSMVSITDYYEQFSSPEIYIIVGFHAGVFMDYALSSKLSLVPELLFTQKGYSADYNITEGITENYTEKITLNFLQLSNNLTYKFKKSNGSEFFPFVGIYLGYGLWTEDEYLFEKFDYGLNFGVGYQYRHFIFKFQCNYGLSRPHTDFYEGNIVSCPISIGYIF
jgi:hypothetical protein